MGRIDCQGSQHAENIPHEILLQHSLLEGRKRVIPHDLYSLFREFGQYAIAQTPYLFLNHGQYTSSNDFQLLDGRELARHWADIFNLEHFLQARNPDHEEFVEITGENRKKF